MSVKNDELSIIVYSCIKNSCMWEPFTLLINKYWNDCCYKIILVTDKQLEDMSSYRFDEVVEIDDTWGRMIKKAMNLAGTPYVMLFMDDYLLCDRVDNKFLLDCVEYVKTRQLVNLRLIESPKVTSLYEEHSSLGRIGVYIKDKAYSLSLQPGIWEVRALSGFINDEWSAWDFERIGSFKSTGLDGNITTLMDNMFPYEEGVRAGKWMEPGVKLLKRVGYDVRKTGKPIMTNFEMAKIYFKGAVLDMNPTFVSKVQNMLKKWC